MAFLARYCSQCGRRHARFSWLAAMMTIVAMIFGALWMQERRKRPEDIFDRVERKMRADSVPNDLKPWQPPEVRR